MNRIDSTKVSLPSDALKLNSLFFENRVGKYEIGYKALKEDFRIFGLKDIHSGKDTTTIEFSAKILGRDYQYGINKNTFENLHSTLVSSGIIDVPIDTFSKAKLCSADFCTFFPSDNGKEIIKDLSLLGLADYQKNTYNTKRNQGITISGTKFTFKERVIFYNKFFDLQKADNSDFLSSLGYKWAEDTFRNLYRLETNITSTKKLKEYLSLGNVTLISALEAEEKVLKKVFQKITEKALNPMIHINQDTLQKEIKIRGLKDVISQFKGNYSDFWRWYRYTNPNNYRRDKQDCIKAYDLYLKESGQTKQTGQLNESVKKIIQHLDND